MSRVFRFLACSIALSSTMLTAFAQASFEEAVVDVGNVGLTITNAGFVGRAGIRNNPTGDPSFEYPLDSGVEHLFEAGLWIGAVRSDGTITVRTAAGTSSGGYVPGASNYEFAQFSSILSRSTLPTSEAYSRSAISHLDYVTTFEDTSAVLPGTFISMPDPSGQLGAFVELESHAWNFPFAEAFVILNFNIVNISGAPWDSVYVGMYHDLVVRNVNTTTDTGTNFYNKGGYGFVDSLNASYAFNAGGMEETLNTYGAVSILGAEWVDPRSGQTRFFHPSLAAEYVADGYSPPRVNPRWWLFSSGGIDELNRPSSDADRYRRMSTQYPNPLDYTSQEAYETDRDAWFDRLRTDGLTATGNWIGLTPIGPFDRVLPGDTLKVAFALVSALKPDDYQGQGGKSVDTPESRSLLATNSLWARRTYAGEDNNFNGVLDPSEDINGNGVLDRYLIPEPPMAPGLRAEFERTDAGQPTVALYWDRSSEESVDPVTGLMDFEGYRVYRSNPGDDLSGNILDKATLIAQYDKPGDRTGFNNGFQAVQLPEPVRFEGDDRDYWYRFEAPNLKNGWQYLFTVTSFDEGDPDVGLESFESSRVANAVRVFPGTPSVDAGMDLKVGVYPNPYRANAAWDGSTSRTRKLNFYNLPSHAEIRVYTLAGEVVKTMDHDGATYTGDTRWYHDFSAENRILPGGEHSWDILSDNSLSLAGGLYLYTVKDQDTGKVQRGKFVIIK